MSSTVTLLKTSAITNIQADLVAAVAANTAAAASSAAAALASQTSAAGSAGSASSSAATALGAITSAFKGGVAGASVAATSTTNGDYYRITSAGTSQSKTWATGDLAIYNGTSGSWTQVSGGITDPASLAAKTGALAPRGGVAFDGTNSTRVFSTLTGQNIGTDAFSISVVLRVPSAQVTNYPALFQIASGVPSLASPYSLRAELDTAGTLGIVLDGASGDATCNVAALSAFVTNWAGKVVHLVFVRNASGNPSLFINGASQTLTFTTSGTPPTWQGSLTSSYLQLGQSSSGRELATPIYSATLYNLALTAADVLEIYELGGAMRERHKYGSQVARYTSDFSAGLDGFNAAGGGYATLTCSGNVDTSADGASIPPSDNWQRADQSGTGRITFYSNASAGLAVYQKTVRISGSIFTPSGSTVTHMVVGFEVLNTTNEGYINSGGLGFIAGSVVALTPGSTTNFDVTAINTVPGSTRAIYFVASNSAGVAQNYTAQKVYLKDVVVRQAGAVCHLGLADGIGRIARDSSTNKLHAIRTATGVSDVIELDDGVVPYTTPSSANGPVIDTAGALRTDCVLVDVIVKNTTANAISGFGLGMSSGVRDLTYDTDIPANATRILPIKRADLTSLTLGTAPYGLVYFSAASWNSGLVKIVIRFRRERDL